MATKRYNSKTGTLVLPIINKNFSRYIDVTARGFDTSDEDTQKAIESSEPFKNGEIAVLVIKNTNDEVEVETKVSEKEAEKDNISETASEKISVETDEATETVSEKVSVKTDEAIQGEDGCATYPHVTSYATAAAILRAAPYKVYRTKVDNPTKIKAVAESLNVSFPNLK